MSPVRIALPDELVAKMTDDELAEATRRKLLYNLRGPVDPRKESELSLRKRIVGKDGLATVFHWDHIGFRAAQTKQGFWSHPGTGTLAKGWPDVTLVRGRDRRLIFAELKGYQANGTRGKLSPDQVAVLDVLRKLETRQWVAGEWVDVRPSFPGTTQVEVYAWWPEDWDQIVEVLR